MFPLCFAADQRQNLCGCNEIRDSCSQARGCQYTHNNWGESIALLFSCLNGQICVWAPCCSTCSGTSCHAADRRGKCRKPNTIPAARECVLSKQRSIGWRISNVSWYGLRVFLPSSGTETRSYTSATLWSHRQYNKLSLRDHMVQPELNYGCK